MTNTFCDYHYMFALRHMHKYYLQCFDTVGWAARRASGLKKLMGAGMVICLG